MALIREHLALEANNLQEVIQREGALCYPNEACGLLIKVGNKSEAIPCVNISTEPKSTFMISTDEYANAADRGEVIGVWHTHIEIPATPSDADRAACEATGVPWYIVSVQKAQDEFVFSETLRSHDPFSVIEVE